MITHCNARSRRRPERGYALILVVFMATMLLLGVIVVAPNIRTEGQREKEKEMIWRGRQYVRGIKLFYRKTHRFPTTLDDLTKPQLGSIRFMRQAYKDPMNKQDGSWRLIYVGPAGQLIGSLKPQQQNIQFGQASGIGTPLPAAPGSNNPVGGLGSLVQTGGQSAFGQFGQQGQGTQPLQPGGTGSSGSTPPGTTGTPVSADQGIDPNAPIPSGDTPTIIGGNIIGVGSKIDKKSIKVYERAKNYRLFEFIWDPSKDAITVGKPGGTGIGQIPGQNTLGQPVQGPANQTPPPQPQQNPQQQQ